MRATNSPPETPGRWRIFWTPWALTMTGSARRSRRKRSPTAPRPGWNRRRFQRPGPRGGWWRIRSYALERAAGLERTDLLRLLESGKYQDLSAGLAEAIQAAPEEPALYLLRAFCWKGLEHTSSRSRTPDMLRDLTRALELEPDNVMALRGRTSLTTTSRRYPQQIQDLTRLMELGPENRDLHQASRAYFHHWLKDDAAARVDLNEVLERGELWTVDLVYLCRELGLPGF